MHARVRAPACMRALDLHRARVCMQVYARARVRVLARARACVRACMHVCMHACVRARGPSWRLTGQADLTERGGSPVTRPTCGMRFRRLVRQLEPVPRSHAHGCWRCFATMHMAAGGASRPFTWLLAVRGPSRPSAPSDPDGCPPSPASQGFAAPPGGRHPPRQAPPPADSAGDASADAPPGLASRPGRRLGRT
jgi:hypothetical protein